LIGFPFIVIYSKEMDLEVETKILPSTFDQALPSNKNKDSDFGDPMTPSLEAPSFNIAG